MRSIPTRIIDSHTGGEPTRIVISGGPDLGSGSMAERRERMRRDHDTWRQALMLEPRGHDVLVGALLCQPVSPQAACGVIFFNNAGYLGMCGHGTIGLVETLAWLGRIVPGLHRIETPVGDITATLHDDRSVSVANVPAYRHAADVEVELDDGARVRGDIAWGGNWFFLCSDHGLPVRREAVPALTARALQIQAALRRSGITGRGGADIDHVELLADAQDPAHQGRSFVLCPGGAYDRSPCGTGTSAKLACLAADGALAPGAVWHQESVIGSVFAAHYQRPVASPSGDAPAGAVLPVIRGRAHVTLDAQVVIDPADPYGWGLA